MSKKFKASGDTWRIRLGGPAVTEGHRNLLFVCESNGQRPYRVVEIPDDGSADDTATGTWALYPAGSRTREAIDVGLAAAGIRPRVIVESGNPAVLRELATLTGSFTVLPEAIAATGLPGC